MKVIYTTPCPTTHYYRSIDEIQKLLLRIQLKQIANAKNPLLGFYLNLHFKIK